MRIHTFTYLRKVHEHTSWAQCRFPHAGGQEGIPRLYTHPHLKKRGRTNEKVVSEPPFPPLVVHHVCPISRSALMY